MVAKDRYLVRHDGEEKTVHNTISYMRPVSFMPATLEKFEPVGMGSSGGMDVEYVTASLAERVMIEDSVDLANHEIEVIDIESDEVEIL